MTVNCRPAPVLAAFQILSLALAWSVPADANSVTKAVCEAGFQDMIAQVEDNRRQAQAEIDRQLKDADATMRESLILMREQSWDQEEQERRQASLVRLDCLRAARPQ